MSRSLNVRSLPDDVLKQVRARMQREGWHSLSDLVAELMRDYGAGRVTPAAAPPPFDPGRNAGRRADEETVHTAVPGSEYPTRK